MARAVFVAPGGASRTRVRPGVDGPEFVTNGRRSADHVNLISPPPLAGSGIFEIDGRKRRRYFVRDFADEFLRRRIHPGSRCSCQAAAGHARHRRVDEMMYPPRNEPRSSPHHRRPRDARPPTARPSGPGSSARQAATNRSTRRSRSRACRRAPGLNPGSELNFASTRVDVAEAAHIGACERMESTAAAHSPARPRTPIAPVLARLHHRIDGDTPTRPAEPLRVIGCGSRS